MNAYSTRATVIKMMIVAPPNHRARSALSQRKKKATRCFRHGPPPPTPRSAPRPPPPPLVLPRPGLNPYTAGIPVATSRFFRADPLLPPHAHSGDSAASATPAAAAAVLHSSDRETVFACLISLQTASEGCACVGVARCCRGKRQRERESVCVCVHHHVHLSTGKCSQWLSCESSSVIAVVVADV